MTVEHTCHKCNGNCHRLNDEQVKEDITRMIIASDIREAIVYIGEPIAEWGFLTNYLAMRGVFE
jgi:hypothetical protein